MNLRFWKKQEVYGVTLHQAGASTQVSGEYYPYVRPEVDFATCYEYYRTIGKVQNAVESYVAEILSRDWYFEGDKEAVRACEEWEDKFNLSRIIEYIVRDWLVCGNSIIGVSDWQPVQISSISYEQSSAQKLDGDVAGSGALQYSGADMEALMDSGDFGADGDFFCGSGYVPEVDKPEGDFAGGTGNFNEPGQPAVADFSDAG